MVTAEKIILLKYKVGEEIIARIARVNPDYCDSRSLLCCKILSFHAKLRICNYLTRPVVHIGLSSDSPEIELRRF